MKILKKRIVRGALIIFILAALFLISRYFFLSFTGETEIIEEAAVDLQEPPLPFEIDENFQYQIRFNGIRVGKIEFTYLGREKVDNRWQDIIEISGKASILGIIRAEGQEHVYLDAKTYLPLRAERRLRYLRRKELSSEEYSQKEGAVKIIRQRNKGSSEKILNVEPPIYNPVSLCFLFPIDLESELLETVYEFNLPGRQISLKLTDKIRIHDQETRKDFFILESSQPRQVKVWLTRDRKIPERVEIPFFFGRVVISRI